MGKEGLQLEMLCLRDGRPGVAVVGAGGIVERSHLPGIKMYCDLEAICSRNLARAEELVKAWGAKAAYIDTDYGEMVRRDDVDIVLIATPNHLHRDQAVVAAEAGKNFLLEKPPARSNKESWDIVEAVERSRVLALVGHHQRFYRHIEIARELVETGFIGELHSYRVLRGLSPIANAKTDWRKDPARAGGGGYADMGVHAVDTMRWIIQADPLEVLGIIDTRFMDAEGYRTDDRGFSLMKMEKRIWAVVNASYFGTPRYDQADIFGREGMITVAANVYGPSEPLLVFTRRIDEVEKYVKEKGCRVQRYPSKNGEWLGVTPPEESPYVRMWKHFTECVVKHGEVRTPVTDAHKSYEAVCAVYLSAKKGGWVKLPLTEEVIPGES